MAAHIEDCDEKVANIADQLAQTDEALATLRQEFDVDHIELEAVQERVQEVITDTVELSVEVDELRETLESQGSLISEHTKDLVDLHNQVDELRELYVAIAKLLKLNP